MEKLLDIRVWLALLAIVATLVLGYWVYENPSRYAIVADSSLSRIFGYKIDKRTGKVWYLFGGNECPVTLYKQCPNGESEVGSKEG